MTTTLGIAGPAVFFTLTCLVSAPACKAEGPLGTLKPQHPRLLFTDHDLPVIRRAIHSDAYAKRQYQELLARGEALLVTPPDKFEISGPEHTLLTVARDLEDRIITLAALYRITGDRRFATRATQEMLSAASYPNWFPWHFLDTAEATTALGIGYDWLYSTLSPQDRKTIREAIVTKSIDPWLALIATGRAHYLNNWSQVCNGGETIGALAIADEEPARAEQVISHARPAIAEIMQLFAPDGGSEEGPAYWNYATIYNALYINSLDSALGTDFGAAESLGFSLTPGYRIQTIGPTNLYANFGDASPAVAPAPQMFWFAKRFHRPAYAAMERQLMTSLDGHMDSYTLKDSERFAALGLFWSALNTEPDAGSEPPLVQSFSRVDQAFMRSAWHNPLAAYIGLKGGDAHASHTHLDLGSFVFDDFGQRWAIDLGADNYGLPGYFTSPKRWSYYRLGTEGHNTITINGENEGLDAKAPLSLVGNYFAIANLDQVYKGKLQSWKRGIMLLDRQRMLVEDELMPIGSVDIVWNFHTAATVEISPDGHSARLTQNGATISARLISPSNGRFATANAEMPLPQASNKGVTNLVVRLPRQTVSQTIAVLFGRPEDSTTFLVRPLYTWH
jgi:Heparinase II/III-like protein